MGSCEWGLIQGLFQVCLDQREGWGSGRGWGGHKTPFSEPGFLPNASVGLTSASHPLALESPGAELLLLSKNAGVNLVVKDTADLGL